MRNEQNKRAIVKLLFSIPLSVVCTLLTMYLNNKVADALCPSCASSVAYRRMTYLFLVGLFALSVATMVHLVDRVMGSGPARR